jgi:hypothetical protein
VCPINICCIWQREVCITPDAEMFPRGWLYAVEKDKEINKPDIASDTRSDESGKTIQLPKYDIVVVHNKMVPAINHA